MMELISPTSYKYLQKWFASKWLYGHPYVWNSARNVPELTTSKIRLTMWYLNVFVFFVNFTFTQFRTFQVYFSTTTTTVERMYMALVSALWCYEAVFRIAGLLKRDEMVDFLQEFFQFLEKNSGKTCV